MKTITTEMESHLEQEVTSLATCWHITRQDGQEFFFTDHDVALTVDGNLYKADSGYKRTAVANDSSLSVDNLDIEGVFDDEEITETDLRAGLFDFARIQIFVVNWDDLSQGIIRMRSGRMGEVNLTEQGVFRSELRGLTQQLSQRIGEVYTPECRADLGDSRCMIPIDPPDRENSTDYEVGDYIKVQTGDNNTQFLVHLNGDTVEEFTGASGTLGANAVVQGVTTKFGSGALEFTPSGNSDATNFCSWPATTDYDINGVGDFCIEGWVNFNTDGGLGAGNEAFLTRGGLLLQFRRTTGGDIFFGAFMAPGLGSAVTLSGSPANVAGTWYHVAATREGNTYRMFFDGVLQDTEVNTGTLRDLSANDLFLGKADQASSWSLDGFLDEWRMVMGEAVYTANFTPPVAEFNNPTQGQGVYQNRIYLCEVAGTSAASQPAYDTTVGQTTVDGTAEFIAEQAWMREGVVDTVTDRKTFTLTVDFDEVRAVDDWFNGGALQFLDGDNAGRSIEIRDWTQSTREVTLFLPASFAIESGTQVRLYPGCDKRLATCRDKFDNVLNFRGEPHVPGQDQFTRYPDAKSA